METNNKLTRREFLAGSGAVIASAVLFNSLTACSPKITTSATNATATKTTTATPKYGGTLKIAWDNTVPAEIGWPPDYGPGGASSFSQPCLESLLRGDNRGNIVPWLAEDFVIADDLKAITFKLRNGVRFHDGTDFNAQTAKWNLDNRITAGGTSRIASVDIIDEYTIRVNVTQWRNTLLSDFADSDSATGYMISPTAFQKNGPGWMKKNPVGTGPFKFVSIQSDVGLKAVRNPDYWGRDDKGNQLPYLDAVEILSIMDRPTRSLFMNAGGGNLGVTYAGKEASDYSAMGLAEKVAITSVYCLIPDTANADSPWANQKVREAVEYAIDREAIAKALGYGYWEAPYQIPSRGCSVYNPDFTLSRKYDLEKAKQLLDEAGYTGNPRFKTTIISFPGDLNRDALAATQSYLTDAGIQAQLDIPEIGVFVDHMMNGWHNAALFFGFTSEANPNVYLTSIFDPLSPLMKSWLRTPEWKQAFDADLSAPKLDVKLARAVTDIMTKDASVIPIHESGGGWAMQPYVMNTGACTRGMIPFLNLEQTWLNK